MLRARACRQSARLLTLACVFGLVSEPAAGAFLIKANEGVEDFVGLELLAAPFAFSRRDFVVNAPITLTRNNEWSTRTCPPIYTGNASFVGSILLHMDAQWTACSFEQHAIAAGQLGAVLWAQWDSDLVKQGMRPGMFKFHWQDGDSRAIPHLALHLTQAEGVPFVNALASERITGVHARVTADRSEWEELWESTRFVVWRAILILASAAVIELAACRLYAFVLADRGLKLTIGNAILGIELLLNVERVIYMSIDPMSSNGSLNTRFYFFLFSIHVPLATITTGLFFIFFVEATRSSGVRPHSLVRKSYKRAFVAFVVLILLVDIVATSLISRRVYYAVVLIYLFVSPVAMRILSTIIALNIAKRARTRLSLVNLPPAILGRLLDITRTTALCSAVTAVCGLLLGLGFIFQPEPRFWVTLVQWLAFTAISYAQCDAFSPPGIRVPRGPLRRIIVFFAKVQRVGVRTARVHVEQRVLVVPKHSESSWLRPSLANRISPSPNGGIEADSFKKHLSLGVSTCFLRDFMAEHNVSSEASTYDVATIVSRLTHDMGMSIAELNAQALDSNGKPAVGRANLFVSHAQQCCFSKLVEAIELHLVLHNLDEAQVVLWIDIFCIRQHAVSDDAESIGDVVAQTGAVIVVLEPWHQPVCLTRAWCLFEMLHCELYQRKQAVKFARAGGSRKGQQMSMHLALAPSEQRGLARAMREDGAMVEAALVNFDSRNAHASVAEDERMIFGQIERCFGGDGGSLDAYDAFNRVVRSAVQRALAAYSWGLGAEPADTPMSKRRQENIKRALRNSRHSGSTTTASNSVGRGLPGRVLLPASFETKSKARATPPTASTTSA